MPRSRARKRNYGEGSVYPDERASGGYRGELTRPPFHVSGTADECHRALDDELARRVFETTEGDDARLGPVVDEWLAYVAAAKAPATRYSDTWALGQLSDTIRAKRLRELRVQDVERELARLSTRKRVTRSAPGGAAGPLGVSSLRRVKATLGAVLEDAHNRDLPGRNVAKFARLPREAAPAGEKVALAREQADRLEQAAETHRLYTLVVVGLRYGLRPGELTGLAWADVDLDGGLLTVCQSLKREPDGSLVLGPTKAKSDRVIKLAPAHVEVLRSHKAAQAAEALKARNAWDEAELGLVFCTEVGGPIDPSNLRRFIWDLCDDAGVERISPNELRHTCTSLLIDAGAAPQAVADLLGHRDVTMLARHYRHRVARVVDPTDALARVLAGDAHPTPIGKARRRRRRS